MNILTGRTFYINVYISNDQNFLSSKASGRGISGGENSRSKYKKAEMQIVHSAGRHPFVPYSLNTYYVLGLGAQSE